MRRIPRSRRVGASVSALAALLLAGCTTTSSPERPVGSTVAGHAAATSTTSTPARASAVEPTLPAGPGQYSAVSPVSDGVPLIARSGSGTVHLTLPSLPPGTTRVLMRATCDVGSIQVAGLVGPAIFGGGCKPGAVLQAASPLRGSATWTALVISAPAGTRWAFSAASA